MKIIIPILVGAAIGYTTNWIAIKMLFKPYYKKQFAGIHVPFTPGLIPKERGRIAKNIGDSVGSYLLTPEVVMKSLSEGRLDEYIINWVESNMERLKKEDRSIKSFMIKFEKENSEKIIKIVKKRVGEIILDQLRKEESKQSIIAVVESHILYSSSEKILKSINENIELVLYRLMESDDMKNELKDVLKNKIEDLEDDDRKLEQVLSDDMILNIKESIKNQDDKIISILKEILENPSMEIEIKEKISKVVWESMSKLITIFVSPDIIADKVFNITKEYIDRPEIGESIELILETISDKVLEYKVGDLAVGISSKLDEDDMTKISEGMLLHISKKENMDKILNGIEEKIKFSKPEIEVKALALISNEIEILLSSEKLNDGIYMMTNQMIEFVLDRPISSLLGNIDEIDIEKMAEILKRVFDDFVKNKLPYIVELFDISKVVEEQINSFDVAFAEEMILQIAHKELKAITWLGALLGGIMGVLSPLLQKI